MPVFTLPTGKESINAGQSQMPEYLHRLPSELLHLFSGRLEASAVIELSGTADNHGANVGNDDLGDGPGREGQQG